MIALLLATLAFAGDAQLDWRVDGTWRSPTPRERVAVVRAVDAVIRDAEACREPVLQQAGETLAQVGLRLDVLTIDEARVVRIGEGSEAFGAGLLAIRCGPAADLVWQAPHPRFDLRTGDLALRWFHESNARAAMWATHHRFRARPDEAREDPVHPADVSAEPGSLFQAMTLGIAVADVDLRFVQLHGFAATTAPGIAAIVSSGDPSLPLEAVGGRLATVLGKTQVFGVDTDELGGTLNVQGRALGRWPGRFLHLELSPATRDRLMDDEAARRSILSSLEGAW